MLIYLSTNRLMQAVLLNEVEHFWFEKLEEKEEKGTFKHTIDKRRPEQGQVKIILQV